MVWKVVVVDELDDGLATHILSCDQGQPNKRLELRFLGFPCGRKKRSG